LAATVAALLLAPAALAQQPRVDPISTPGLVVDQGWQWYHGLAPGWQQCARACEPEIHDAARVEDQALEQHTSALDPGLSQEERSRRMAEANRLFRERGDKTDSFRQCVIDRRPRPTAADSAEAACPIRVCQNIPFYRDKDGKFHLGEETAAAILEVSQDPAPKHPPKDEICWDAYFRRLRNTIFSAWSARTRGQAPDQSLGTTASFDIVTGPGGGQAITNILGYGDRKQTVEEALCAVPAAHLRFPARSKLAGQTLRMKDFDFRVTDQAWIKSQPRRYFELRGKLYVTAGRPRC
jgi:hypothetical protein